MASRKISMFSEKKFELEELQEKIKEEFSKLFLSDIEFKEAILRELGDTKTLLLIFEKWYLRTSSYASLVIMVSDYKGYQCADVISTGGKENFISLGAEENFLKCGEDVLLKLGFNTKYF